MSGNVWEWTDTAWNQVDGATTRDRPKVEEARVLRGGAFDYDARSLRCASRISYVPSFKSNSIGFRIVRRS